MATKLSNSVKSFLDYGFHGNGKYYTTEQGSKAYKNTSFFNFAKYNGECVVITESGNDAPRGGRTGDYVIVKFTEFFTEKYGWYLEEKRTRKNKEAEALALYKSEYPQKNKEAKEKWTLFLKNNPEKSKKWHEKIENMPSNSSRSGNWRSFLKLKFAKHCNNEVFSKYISAPELDDILNEMNK